MSKSNRLRVLGGQIRFNTTGGNVGNVGVPELMLKELVEYLNHAKTAKSRRVLRILQQMHELERIEPPEFTEPFEGPWFVLQDGLFLPNPILERIAPEKYRIQIDIERRTVALNKEMARYRFTPYVTNLSANQWLVIWRIAGQKRRQDEGSALPGGELDLIFNLARSGYLDRLRRCQRCKEWLFAKTSHQVFCSKSCQQENYTRTPEFRERRRVYAHDRYHDHMPSRRSLERSSKEARKR